MAVRTIKKTVSKERNYYQEIDNAISQHERVGGYKQFTISWICDRIDWCWKFRHINEEQKNELCDRIIAVMEGI